MTPEEIERQADGLVGLEGECPSHELSTVIMELPESGHPLRLVAHLTDDHLQHRQGYQAEVGRYILKYKWEDPVSPGRVIEVVAVEEYAVRTASGCVWDRIQFEIFLELGALKREVVRTDGGV